MKPLGIIANPASGRDVRRLVAQGSVVSNMEKLNTVRRVLLAAQALGVREAFLMPDREGLARQALAGAKLAGLRARLLETSSEGVQEDSLEAASALANLGAGAVVTLGGDGTNRVVCKTLGEVPVAPISTGTNNVFPKMMEGTLVGLAAGLLCLEKVTPRKVCRRAPVLILEQGGQVVDQALIDLVVTDEQFIGARAVWKRETVKEIFLSRVTPAAIGFSAIGGLLGHGKVPAGHGMHLVLGPGGEKVLAPIAPGNVEPVEIASWQALHPDTPLQVSRNQGVIALDGEREVYLDEEAPATVRLSAHGPLVVDLDLALGAAAEAGVFILP